MLEGLRKNMKIIIWGIIVVFMATIFIAWGLHFTSGKGLKNYAAKVNGKKISYENFNTLYRQWADRYRKLYGDGFDDQMAENLKKIILNNLVFNELLYQEALKSGIKVTPYEIEEGLKSLQIFQNESGQFDPGRYMQGKKVLPRSWWREQSEEMKRTMLGRKLELSIRNCVKASNEDMLSYYREKNASTRMDYILAARRSFDVSVSDRELGVYYEKNKEKARKPDEIKVEYLAAPKPSEEDIPDSAARNTIITNLKATMDNAYKEMEKDKKGMQAAGNKYNLEYSKTPFFTRVQNQDNEDFQVFSRYAFMLSDPGELSDLIESPKYYYILRLVQRIDSHVPTMEEAGKDMKDELVSQRQDELAKKRIDEIRAKIGPEGEKNIAPLIKTTPFFNAWKEIPGIQAEDGMKSEIQGLKAGEWSRALRTKDGYCLVKVIERKVPVSITVKDTQALEDLGQELLRAKEYQILQEWYRVLREKAKIENALFKENGEENPMDETGQY